MAFPRSALQAAAQKRVLVECADFKQCLFLKTRSEQALFPFPFLGSELWQLWNRAHAEVFPEVTILSLDILEKLPASVWQQA